MFTVIAILVLAVLVFVHELGHFLAARWQGIRVHSFSLGFGPVLWQWQGKEVTYCVRAIPLGGFVSFPDDSEEETQDLLAHRPLGQRAIVMLAGVTANFIFAYLLLVIVAWQTGTQVLDQPGLRVLNYSYANSPAAVAGIKPGDIILAVDDRDLGNGENIIAEFQKEVARHKDQSMLLTISRQGERLFLSVSPQGSPPRIGILLDYAGRTIRQPFTNPLAVMQAAAVSFANLCQITLQGLQGLLTNFSETAKQLAGPVAIVATGSRIAQSSWTELLNFAAIISINLAIINLLPLPALDGGQLLFLLLEALRGGNPLPKEIQENVMQGGLVVLLSLGMFMIFRDSYNLLQDYLEQIF
ncbi:MAG: RIP metalloprotease RseP [Pseudanabaenaceae cyanobacterium SKYGB_i_bin29]|nr:RIP metalloprotease RseP [Pseudanabaenaceae cyanobacterium SKYG29]MDW8422528.1 RIP metalloprotease RseP [Pseudanabaenaceae cyanobacterium SKYGB_i_bin29]